MRFGVTVSSVWILFTSCVWNIWIALGWEWIIIIIIIVIIIIIFCM
jgi:hypothetical protein